MEIKLFFEYILGIIWFLVLSFISFRDIKYRQVSNREVLLVFILAFYTGYFYELSLNFYAFFLVFIFGFIFFKLKVLGAGDVKLLLAFVLLIKTSLLYEYFLLMSFIGFLQALYFLVKSKILKKKQTVAYAVAISSSFYIYFLFYIVNL